MSSASLFRLSAFTTTPEGGNPAGVWIGDELPEAGEMLRIARQVGFSETAFIAPTHGRERIVRYYSPEAQVPFCGHATIAAGVKLGQINGEGKYRFYTAVGEVVVTVRKTGELSEAELTSVTPKHTPPSEDLVRWVLATLSWSENALWHAQQPLKFGPISLTPRMTVVRLRADGCGCSRARCTRTPPGAGSDDGASAGRE